MFLVWIPVLLNMLACKSRMVPHVTVGTIDPWIFAILVNAKRAANPMDSRTLAAQKAMESAFLLGMEGQKLETGIQGWC